MVHPNILIIQWKEGVSIPTVIKYVGRRDNKHTILMHSARNGEKKQKME